MIDRYISIMIVWFFYCFMYFLSTGKIILKERKSLVTLGALTYPLYLIHNFAGKAIIDALSKTIPESIAIIMVICMMLLASWAIHTVIEKPLATPLKNYLFSILSRNKSLLSPSGRQPSSTAD